MSMIIPNIEEFIAEQHEYRQMLKVVNWDELVRPLRSLYSATGAPGFAVSQGFKCLFLQFLLDKSDREMEQYLRYDLSAKFFCGFGLKEQTPDHSYFGRFRMRVGTARLGDLFKRVNESLKIAGLIRQVYSFVDAGELRARVNVWEARDRAVADRENNETDDDGNPTMNNRNAGNYSSDPEARFGCKGKDKIWFGFKRHITVDMSHGLIADTAVTPANTPDAVGIELVGPSQGMIFADKAYCSHATRQQVKERGCHSGIILKNNMKEKNRQKDRWLSSLRMPYEGTFASLGKHARYRGVLKNQFQALMQAFAFNLKRLVRIAAPPINLVPI